MPRHRLPAQIREALTIAHLYRVKPSDRGGFNVWKFRDWNAKHPGWRVIATSIPDSATAWIYIIDRLGLRADDEPKPEPPKTTQARIVWSASGEWEPW